nr:MAG: RNA-dependent RNA polymerase [Yellow silver pine associated botourmia-like virus 23]
MWYSYMTTIMATTEYKQNWPPPRYWRHTKASSRAWFRREAMLSKQLPAHIWCLDSEGSSSWTNPRSNPFAVLRDEGDTVCARYKQNIRKVLKIVKLLEVDQSLKPVQPVPSTVPCGSIRKAVRSMYPPELTLAQELSIKTSAKAESQPCTLCENLQGEKLDEWENARFQPRVVEEDHLEAFAKAFRMNVPHGWDLRRTAYVPNGHASLGKSRCHGGNWNETPFSEEVEVQLVHSSGKPRVVTLYSSHNVAVLTPLHNSLYNCLRRRGWLLVGSPSDESLRYLSDGTKGQSWLSFDYESATDNINTAYVQRAVEILVEQAAQLSEDEISCLRVFSSLKLGGRLVESGQPMGSPLSFPLLCLINKTVVDLALSSLRLSGEIPVKEWTGHRCLINGDDLLTKSTSRGDLVAAVSFQGAFVGLRVNAEKTMSSVRDAEINSTAFRDGKLVRKTNVSALWMGSEVEDVTGFADDSCVTSDGFRSVVENNLSRLAKAEKKVSRNLPWKRREKLCSSRRLKAALHARPVGRVPNPTNLFPVVPKPHGYDLTFSEGVDTVTSEVVRIRKIGSWVAVRPSLAAFSAALKDRVVEYDRRRCVRDGVMHILRVKNQPVEDRTLSVLAQAWEYKRKEQLVREESSTGDLLPPSDFSQIRRFIDCIKTFKQKKELGPKPTSLMGDPFEQSFGFVSLTDE